MVTLQSVQGHTGLNLHFNFFDIRALWCSVVSARVQGRHHGFESGGDKFCERSEQKFLLDPPLFGQRGTTRRWHLCKGVIRAICEIWIIHKLCPLPPLPLKVGVMSPSSYGSAAHARVPKCQKLKGWVRPIWRPTLWYSFLPQSQSVRLKGLRSHTALFGTLHPTCETSFLLLFVFFISLPVWCIIITQLFSIARLWS